MWKNGGFQAARRVLVMGGVVGRRDEARRAPRCSERPCNLCRVHGLTPYGCRGRQVGFAQECARVRGGDAEYQLVLGVSFSDQAHGAALPPALAPRPFRAWPPRRDYHAAVTILRRDHGPVGRYSLDDVVLEIAKLRERLGLRDRDVYEACGISQPQWAHKMANAGKSRFTVRELGLVADFFSRKLRRPLSGWPMVPLAVCDEMEAALETAHAQGKRRAAGHR